MGGKILPFLPAVKPFAATAAQTGRCVSIVRVGHTNMQQTHSFEQNVFRRKFPSEKLPDFGC
jgi:hypothetical protein